MTIKDPPMWLVDNREQLPVYWVKYQLLFKMVNAAGQNQEVPTGLLQPIKAGGYLFTYRKREQYMVEHIGTDILREAKRMAKVLYQLGVRS